MTQCRNFMKKMLLKKAVKKYTKKPVKKVKYPKK